MKTPLILKTPIGSTAAGAAIHPLNSADGTTIAHLFTSRDDAGFIGRAIERALIERDNPPPERKGMALSMTTSSPGCPEKAGQLYDYGSGLGVIATLPAWVMEHPERDRVWNIINDVARAAQQTPEERKLWLTNKVAEARDKSRMADLATDLANGEYERLNALADEAKREIAKAEHALAEFERYHS